jgi:hypothetical protein
MPYHEEWHECFGMPFVEVRYEPTVEEILIELERIEKDYKLALENLDELAEEFFNDDEGDDDYEM